MTPESEMRKVIIRIVLRLMLPLSGEAVPNEAREKANEIIGKIVTPARLKDDAIWTTISAFGFGIR